MKNPLKKKMTFYLSTFLNLKKKLFTDHQKDENKMDHQKDEKFVSFME